jgi:Na+/proline symporter
MSSLTSIFNSSSTIFTMDIYPRLRSKPSEVELLLVGQLFVLVLVAISIVFWPRTNEPGAFWGLMVGLVVGLIRFGMEFSYNKPYCGDFESEKPPAWWYTLVDDIHYLHFGLLLWLISGVVSISVSLMTPPPPEDSLHRLTW